MQKIVLTQDVANVGSAGEIVEVRPGYARNYLIPQNLAIPATKGALKQAELIKATATRRRAKDLATAQGLANAISAVSLTFQRRVGENGRLYGSVTSAEIAEEISKQIGQEIDRRKVVLDEAIKNLGDFDVTVNVLQDINATVKVTVEGENGEKASDYAQAEGEEYPVDQPMADY
jgi:large subunit ribosomal protein L9